MEKKETAVAPLQIDNTQAGIVVNGMFGIPQGEFELVSGNYLNFEVGQTYNVVLMGLVDGSDYNDRNKIVPESAVELVTSNGSEVINQDAVMISTVKKLRDQGKQFPCMLRIYCNGIRQNSKGKDYKDLSIAYAPITQAILDAIGA